MAETNSTFAKILRRGSWAGLTVFVLTFVGGIILSWAFLPMVYCATALVEFTNPIPNEIEVMESPDLLKSIIEDAHLKEVLEDQNPGAKSLSSEEILAYLQKNLKIARKPGTDFFEVTVTSERPDMAASIANALATTYKNAGDTEETMREHQSERDELQAKIDQQQTGMRNALAKRNDLIQALAKKGISIPTDDAVLNQSASGQNAKEDPELLEYKRNEHELIVRQSILQSYMARAEMLSYAGISKKGPVQIINLAEVPKHPSRHSLVLGVLVSALVGVILGAIAGMIIGTRKMTISAK
jgi:uncharacterized protein involved in exopolysaccharide biosynthesis